MGFGIESTETPARARQSIRSFALLAGTRFQKHNGVMVSVSGQLDLHYVPFEKLVDPKTLVTVVRFIPPGSDFHQLARFLESSASE